jgi:hypothetical protein
MRVTALFLSAILASPLSVPPPAVAANCLGPVIAVGPARQSVNMARKFAIEAWRDKVIAAHGTAYASWPSATRKSFNCFEPNSKNPNLQGFMCKVLARPCQIFLINPRLKDVLG